MASILNVCWHFARYLFWHEGWYNSRLMCEWSLWFYQLPQIKMYTIYMIHSKVETMWNFLALLKPLKINLVQGCHGRFLAGKTATVAATSPVRRPCCLLFCKIQARPQSWWSCLQHGSPAGYFKKRYHAFRSAEVQKSARQFSHGLDLSQSDVANEFSIYSNCIKISRKTVQMESLVETNSTKCI